MQTTFFRPSIHGWPFFNCYDYKVQLPFHDATLNNLGYCGGMCWTALQRFYDHTLIDRNTPEPTQGTALYNEILKAQIASLPVSTLAKIYLWQTSPDLGHWYRNHSIGHMTQQEWSKVKDSIDQIHPVTLSLITSSNDGDPLHLTDNHRVVAYAYEIRPLYDGEWVHGNINPNIRHITLSIYDPNFPNDDSVCLTFYTGCDDSWIGMKHTYENFHGFFLDDQNRAYVSNDETSVSITSCAQTAINSPTLADYELKFSWKSRIIPYFLIQIDGQNWCGNSLAKASLTPAMSDNKQCPAPAGNLTVKLMLPRAISQLSVRLLDSDSYTCSMAIDAHPTILCDPYVHTRASGDAPEVCDNAISNADLFIKNANPTQVEVDQLDTSPFRWIILRPQHTTVPPPQSGLTTTHVQMVYSYRLGNITSPILANFVEKNMAAPTRLSGIVTVRRGQLAQLKSLSTMTANAQRIFDGFTNNPTDYDSNTRVEFTFRSVDRFGVTAQGTATFFAQSIIYQQTAVEVQTLDPALIGRLDAVAHQLIEGALLGIAVGLDPFPGPGKSPFPPVPPHTDFDALVDRLGSDHVLSGLIDQAIKSVGANNAVWNQIWGVQSDLLKGATANPFAVANPQTNLDRVVVNEREQQLMYDGVISCAFAQMVTNKLICIPAVQSSLTSVLKGQLFPVTTPV